MKLILVTGFAYFISLPSLAFFVGAHQGGAFGPEAMNSLKQFQQAGRWGADIVEMDLRITKDGVAIVFHDEDLSPLTDCRGKVRDKTWAEVSTCHFSGREYGPSRFDAVLDWAGGQITVNAEFKDDDVIPAALAALRAHSAHSWVYFQCQNNRGKYEHARSIDPNASLLYRVENEEDLKWAASLNDPHLKVIEIHKRMANSQTVDAIHAMGKLASMDSFDFSFSKELFGATCDKVFALGIDIAITNAVRDCLKQRPSAPSDQYR